MTESTKSELPHPPRAIGEAFPWLVERLYEIDELLAEGRPGLARAKIRELTDRLQGRKP